MKKYTILITGPRTITFGIDPNHPQIGRTIDLDADEALELATDLARASNALTQLPIHMYACDCCGRPMDTNGLDPMLCLRCRFERGIHQL